MDPRTDLGFRNREGKILYKIKGRNDKILRLKNINKKIYTYNKKKIKLKGDDLPVPAKSVPVWSM